MCHCHCGRHFIAFLCSSIFAQGYVHPGINPGFVSIVVVWQENLFEFALVIEMSLKWKGKNEREGILNIRCGNILAARCRRCAAGKRAADSPHLVTFWSGRPKEASNRTQRIFKDAVARPGTPKGGKDTRSSVHTLKGEGHILTEMQWGQAQAQFCCPAHLCAQLSYQQSVVWEASEKSSCCLRKRKYFKDTQSGQCFLLL